MKEWFKKVTGVAKLEQLKKEKKQLEKDRQEAEEKLRLAKMTPKERATEKGEAWVEVLDIKLNEDNIRNGFFELDWNDQFILDLKQAGYGYDGDPDEEIVDRWFRDIAYQMLAEEGLSTDRGAGYINVVPISNNKSEVS